MSAERRRVWGELAAWHAAEVVRHIPFTGRALNVDAINPYGERRENADVAPVKEFIAQRAWLAATAGVRSGQ